jgi:hypothetical protein
MPLSLPQSRRARHPVSASLCVFTLALLTFVACRRVQPFSVAHVDRGAAGASKFPLAIDPSLVGSFPGRTKSGAGYFYDEVLEYRVWLHPERGARRLAGDEDYYAAFARYENAVAYSGRTEGAEAPLVLIRQREYVNEPTPGTFTWEKAERLTEWQVKWLKDSLRGPTSIPNFLANPRSAEETP